MGLHDAQTMGTPVRLESSSRRRRRCGWVMCSISSTMSSSTPHCWKKSSSKLQVVLFIAAQDGRPTGQQHALEQWFGRAVADRRIDLDHRHMVACSLHLGQMVGGIPVQEAALAGAGNTAQQETTCLAQAAVAADGIQFLDEGLEGRRQEKREVGEPQLAVGQTQDERTEEPDAGAGR